MIEEKIILKNLNPIYKQHTVQDYTDGVEFYKTAHSSCLELARKYNITHAQACGIVACLSPRLRWEFNIRAAERFLEGNKKVHTTTQVGKCEKILQTTCESTIVKIINGEKTVSFYNNMFNFADVKYVTIDRHAIRAAYNQDIIRISAKEYQVLKNTYTKAAKKHKLTPLQYQAVVWCVQRRLYKNNLKKYASN